MGLKILASKQGKLYINKNITMYKERSPWIRPPRIEFMAGHLNSWLNHKKIHDTIPIKQWFPGHTPDERNKNKQEGNSVIWGKDSHI